MADSAVRVRGLSKTYRVPVREADPVFADTRYRTVPLPLPLQPLVIVIQEPDRVAVHEQPLAAVTLTEPVALGGLKPRLVGVTV